MTQPMSLEGREKWDGRHRAGEEIGAPEPFVIEMIPRMRADGRALDVAAGRGRHSVALAEAGMQVVAVDYSEVAAAGLMASARDKQLRIEAVVADLEAPRIPFRVGSFDTILNVNFLDRGLIDLLKTALRPGGVLLLATFLIRQAEIGAPKDPRFLLRDGELRELMRDLEVKVYREGLVTYASGKQAWRASAVGIRR
jgi:SAM-dependent methyltransferase